MTESTTGPGWYPSNGRLRWWDGRQWTEHTQPLPSGDTPAAPGPEFPAGAIWHATGKPLTGIGAGRYWLTEEYLYFEKGALRTNSEQIPIHQVFDIDAKQSISQKARGVGTITVHVQRGPGTEVVELEDVPSFREGVAAINQAARARREQLEVRANTQTVNYNGGGFLPAALTPAAAPAAPTGSASDDIFAQLEKLGRLRDAGVLTPEEFDRTKAELLARL